MHPGDGDEHQADRGAAGDPAASGLARGEAPAGGVTAAGAAPTRLMRRVSVFYGWPVLAVATLGLAMTTPGQTVGVSVFLDPMIADLGLTRDTVSLLYTLGTLAGAAALPLVGRALDLHGPRTMVGIVAAGLALACVLMSQVAGAASLAIGFVAIRALGQGALSLVCLHAISIWFVRRRGLAVGISGLGMAGAVAFFPSLIEALVGAFGWRAAYASLGGVVALTILPLGVLVLRRHPEHYGLTPDGRRSLPPPTRGRREVDVTAEQARRSFAFWFLAAAVGCISALSTGLIFHHFDLMATRGVDRAAAAAVFVPLALVSAAANFGGGLLIDRTSPRFVVAGMLTAQAGALLLATGVGPGTVALYGVVLGVTQGAMGAVSGTAFAAYFGRLAIGGIRGTAQTVSVGGAAAGPVLLAWGHTLTGSYGPPLVALALVPAAMAIVSLFVRRPGASATRQPEDAEPGGPER